MSRRETRAALKIPFCSLIAPDLTIITAWNMEHGLFAKQEANARRKSFSIATPRRYP